MKTRRIILVMVLIAAAFISQAQYRKNGMPDMRYSGNKIAYGSSYSLPSISLPTTVSFPSTISYPEVRLNSGYTRTNGTEVSPYYSTVGNGTNIDNFSTKGNSNPFTGEAGSRAIDYSNGALNYGSGKTIFEGPRGGQYYHNDNGGKTYVPKQPFGF